MSVLIALLSACAWSLFDLKRKRLVQQVPSLPLAMWLSACVIPVYVLLCWWSQPTWPGADYWLPALGSLLVSTMAAVSFIQALKVGQISLLMPVLALTPVISACLSWWWLADGLALRELMAMLVIVILLFLLQGGANFRWRAGMGYMLLVALGWGTGTVFDKWALASAEPFAHALVQSSGMLVLLALVLAVRGELKQAAPRSLPFASLLLAALVFVLAVSAQLYALQSLHAGIIETIKRGVGMLGALLWGVWLFNERIERSQVLLVVLLVAAIAWLMWPA
ncbi:DMT family transporter [Bacterioplanes sanyensis]|uniref:DMT family transporter n=1 Tax=Bacterioplanes sanyensis TaxID=1249553 RepID=UPI0016733B7F|nr:DMT family transporter [Bacterioplanes sanyensis]